MQKDKLFAAAALTIGLLALTSCDPITDLIGGDTTTGTELSGVIATDKTLKAGSYTVTADLYVDADLTIEAGTTLYFQSSCGMKVRSEGTITAVGTKDKNITFTSAKTVKAAGDWDGIGVNSNSGTFTYCVFSYAANALTLNGTNESVTLCTFSNNTIGLDADDSDTVATIANNAFTANGTPLLVNGKYDLGNTNTFTDNTSQYVSHYGNIASARSWTLTSVPIRITSDLYVDAAFTLGAGVTLAFDSDCALYVRADGSITAKGTATEPITFTSSKTTKAADDWSGIIVSCNSGAFEYCDIRYAETGLTLVGTNLSVKNCTLANNTIGVDAENSDTVATIQDNAFTSNGTPLLVNAKYDLDNSNAFTTNTNQYVGVNGIITASRAWALTDVPLRFTSDVYVEAPLSISAGVTLTFMSSCGLHVRSDGSITATGTAANPITFTSAKTTKAKGDWDGISVGDDVTITYGVIEYAATGVSVSDSGLLSLTNSTVRNCTTGVSAGTDTWTNTGNTFTDNGTDVK